MSLIMYIHDNQNRKKGYSIKVNEEVEAVCEGDQWVTYVEGLESNSYFPWI